MPCPGVSLLLLLIGTATSKGFLDLRALEKQEERGGGLERGEKWRRIL